MKKLFITIAFVAAAMFAQAQFFIGGSLGMDYTKAKLNSTDVAKVFSWDVTPSVGFMFNDKMGVGLDLGIGMITETNLITDDKENITVWAVAPYFRYVFAEVDNFKFYADAKVALGGGKPRIKVDNSWNATGIKATYFGAGIVPGMAYMLTDNISMNCTLNILSLGFKQNKITGDNDFEYQQTEFDFGVNDSTPIEIGFFYTF